MLQLLAVYLLYQVLKEIVEAQRGREMLINLALVLGAIIGVVALKGVATYGQIYLANVAAQRLVMGLRQRLYDNLQRLSVAFFDSERTGHLMSRVVADTSLAQTILTGDLVSMVTAPVRVVGGVVLMFSFSWKLTLASFFAFPFTAWLIQRAGMRMRRLTGQVQSKIADLSVILHETLSAIRLIRAYGTEEFEKERFGQQNLTTTRTSLKAARVTALLTPLVEVVAVCCFAFAFWIGGV